MSHSKIHRSIRRYTARTEKEGGIALIMVLMVIALAAALTAFMASSTYFGAKLHKNFVQRTQAEYILKSALNVSRVLIATATGDADPPRDSWGLFVQGRELSAQALGVNIPNATVGLEISAVDAKLPLKRLKDDSLGQPGPAYNIFLSWRASFARLFTLLGFDNDNERVLDGQFKGRVFGSEELVANLIDYFDDDPTSYAGDQGFATGIESILKAENEFPNKYSLSRLEELENVPGFTANRIRKLSPYITTEDTSQINVNLTSSIVLQALDPAIDQQSAQNVVEYARGPDGPLNGSNYNSVLSTMLPNFSQVSSRLAFKSQILQVIAKTQFGGSRYFLRAYLQKATTFGGAGSPPDLPDVLRVETYG